MDDYPGFDIEIENWSKRRSAILYLLDNPRIPDYSRVFVRILAFQLCEILKINGHPMCAYVVQLRLSGVRAQLINGKVIIIEQMNVEDLGQLP